MEKTINRTNKIIDSIVLAITFACVVRDFEITSMCLWVILAMTHIRLRFSEAELERAYELLDRYIYGGNTYEED